MLHLFRTHPEIAVFACIALGYWIGKMKLLGFSLGATASVLLAALLIGQLAIPIPDLLKNVSFALFIFTVGYRVGPQLCSLKKEGLHYVMLSLFFALAGLATAYIVAKAFALNTGAAAGVLGGALTQSSAIPAATSAIEHLAIPAAKQKALEDQVAVAYAITYLFGTAGVILFIKLFLPRLMGIDLKAEAKRLGQTMSLAGSGSSPPEFFSWSNRLDLRTYLIEKAQKRSVQAIEKEYGNQIEIKEIKREGRITAAEKSAELRPNDCISVIGPTDLLVKKPLGQEVYEKQMHREQGEILDVCLLNKAFVGQTLGEVSLSLKPYVFLRRITRQGQELPLTEATVLHTCDVLRIAGAKKEVDATATRLGYPERESSATDLVFVGIGCMLGTLLGLFAFKIGTIPLTLGVSGGILLAGLGAGHLRSLHPTFGYIPTSAEWIFTDLGLNLFIACIGLMAAEKGLSALEQSGSSVFFAGVIVSLVPHTLTAFFGKYVLRMNSVLLFGALAGAGTINGALSALKDEADSSLPVLGYSVPYTIGNVLLTAWGSVLVALL